MKNNKKGFTLLELLVVILIIGILAAIALPQYQRVKERTIMAEGVQIAKQVAEANMRYYLVRNQYAGGIADLDIEFGGTPVKYLGIDRVETVNFIISPVGTSETTMATIQRKPLSTIYNIFIRRVTPNITSCEFYSNATEIQKQLCTKLNQQGYL